MGWYKKASFWFAKYSVFVRDGFWKVNRMNFVSWFPELPTTRTIMSLRCHNFFTLYFYLVESCWMSDPQVGVNPSQDSTDRYGILIRNQQISVNSQCLASWFPSYRPYIRKKRVRVKLSKGLFNSRCPDVLPLKFSFSLSTGLTDHELKRIRADWCETYGNPYSEASLPPKRRLLRFEDEMLICD